MLEVEARRSVLALVWERAIVVLDGLRRWIADDPRLFVALSILTVICTLAVFAPLIAPYDPETPDLSARLVAPSRDHFFGTDVNGMDVFSRVIYAPRVDLVIAISSVVFSLIGGTILGLPGGYFLGRRGIAGLLAEILNRLMDIVQSFPVFIVALAMVGVVGPGVRNVIAVLAFLLTPIFFRFVRAEVLSVRERLFIEAAIAIGNPRWKILFRHLGMNSIVPALVQASPTMGFAILMTAGLSFLGAGVRPPTPEWGAMIATGQEQIYVGRWWPSMFPGMAIALTVFSLAVIGESLRARLEE